MNGYSFLLDECLAHAVRAGLWRHSADIQVLVMGGTGAPSLSTSDPEILRWLEAHSFCLVTDDRSTMQSHLGDHLLAGGHLRGLFVRRPGAGLGALIDDLILIWEAARPDEFADRVTFLPLRPLTR